MNTKNIKILLFISMYISGSCGVDKIEKDKGKMSSSLHTSQVPVSDELSQYIIAQEMQNNNKKHVICPYPGCGRFVYCKSQLNIHMRTHAGERPYKCRYSGCTRDFSHKSALKSSHR
jgi:uncharacterized Zn-finger protein